MAIATTMNINKQENIAFIINNTNNNNDHDNDDNVKGKQEEEDDHEHDLVMPGFRFYPTEEELIEFYLRRKVQGKRFHVELITFLDLYRYDPWELPGLAAMGEKEWYFYVPRDKKYRNGDRPNRVTTSGYWKATGADRMIRSENNRGIGLKKTLVFYTGKAPKGIRTSWIMNEYRLPQPYPHSQCFLKAEISLCRVYKRAGVEDHPSVPRSLPLSGKKNLQHHQNAFKGQSPMHTFSTHDPMMAHQQPLTTLPLPAPLPPPPPTPPSVMDRMAHIRTNNHHLTIKQHQDETKQDQGNSLIPLVPQQHHQQPTNMEEISRLFINQQAFLSQQTNNNHGINTTPAPNSQYLFTNYLLSPSNTLLPHSSMFGNDINGGGTNYSERLCWEWNPFPDHN